MDLVTHHIKKLKTNGMKMFELYMLSIVFTNEYKGIKDKTLVFPRLKTQHKMSNILSQNLSLFSCIITYLGFTHFALDVGTKSSSAAPTPMSMSSSARQNIEIDNIFIDDSSLNHVINSA